ncbi:HAD family hydrolase [Paenibacillus taichungensis]
MAIIFDLDQTLVDSMAAESLRRSRNWKEVYRMIPSLSPYEGIDRIFEILSMKNIPHAIVTSSPTPYCKRVISHLAWDIPITVCYHDTSRRKPYPDPILLAVEKLGLAKEDILSIGDDPRDIQASKAAGVKAGAALWGIENHTSILRENPDCSFYTVKEFEEYILKRY